jgi:hypothetical protein
MGLKFGREYPDIMNDLAHAIGQLGGFYDVLEMAEEDWNELDSEQQQECLKTLADDIFYGLGSDPSIHIGAGVVRYDKDNHIIKVHNGDNLISVIYLV